jgi:hypothetical protein
MARPKGIDWTAVASDYAFGLSTAELASKHEVSGRVIRLRKAIDRRAGRPWPRLCGRAGGRGEDTLGADTLAPSLRALDGGRCGRHPLPPIDFDPSTVTDEQLADLLRGAAAKMLLDWNEGRVEPGLHQSAADVFARVVATVASAIAVSRSVSGRTSGQASEAASSTPTQRVTIVRRVVAAESA